jgi:excisionase family DNA binding protein
VSLTVHQAAERAGRDPETVRQWIRSGRLRSRKVGTQHVIDESDLEALLDEGDEMLPVPDEWKVMSNGDPQINWVRIIRRSREGH